MTSVSEAELRAQETRLLTAMRRHDMPVLSALFDPEYAVTSSRGVIWGRERALQDFLDPAFSLREVEIEVERVFPLADAGVVIGRSRISGEAGGGSVSGAYRFTRVWRRAEAAWTILTTHTSRSDPPT